MRSRRVTGIVLKRSNFGEADKIVTIFTKEEGKIKVLAKGIRRLKSHRAPHLELFNLVELVLHNGKTFSTVTEAKTVADHSVLKANLKITGFLFYLSEFLDKILPEHQPHPDVFIGLLAALPSLDESKVKTFIVESMWNLGYLPYGEYPKNGVTDFVESIVEKRINSKKFLEEL